MLKHLVITNSSFNLSSVIFENLFSSSSHLKSFKYEGELTLKSMLFQHFGILQELTIIDVDIYDLDYDHEKDFENSIGITLIKKKLHNFNRICRQLDHSE